MRYLKFGEDYREILIQRTPPADWRYPLFNRDCCYMFASQGKDKLHWLKNEPPLHPCHFDLYIRDERSGQSWSIVNKLAQTQYEDFSWVYGPSSLSIESVFNGITAVVKFVVPTEGCFVGVSVKICTAASSPTDLQLFTFLDLEQSQDVDIDMNLARFQPDCNAILLTQRSRADNRQPVGAFLYASEPVKKFDCCHEKIYGRTSLAAEPVVLRLGKTHQTMVNGGKMAALLVHGLAPQGTVDCSFLFGVLADPEQEQVSALLQIVTRFGAPEMLREAENIKAKNDNLMLRQHHFLIENKAVSGYFNYWLRREILFNIYASHFFYAQREIWFRDMLGSIQGYLHLAAPQEFFTLLRYLFELGSQQDYFSLADAERVETTLDFIYLITGFLSIHARFEMLEKFVEPGHDLLHFSAVYLYDLLGQRTSAGLVRLGYFKVGRPPIVHENVTLTIRLYKVVGAFVRVVKDLPAFVEIYRKLVVSIDEMRESINTTAGDHGYYPDVIYTESDPKSIEVDQFSLKPQLMALLCGLVPADMASALNLKVERRMRTVVGYLSLFPAYTAYEVDRPDWTALPPGIKRNGGILVKDNILKFRVDCLQSDGRLALQTLKNLVPMTASRIVSQEKSLGEPYFIGDSVISLLHQQEEGVTTSGMVGGNAGLLYDAWVSHYPFLQDLLN